MVSNVCTEVKGTSVGRHSSVSNLMIIATMSSIVALKGKFEENSQDLMPWPRNLTSPPMCGHSLTKSAKEL